MAIELIEATNDQAYAKWGAFGLTGAGKTYGTALVIIGFHKMLKEGGYKEGKNPVVMADTESGSAWVQKMFAKEGIKLLVPKTKTRAFSDLPDLIAYAEEQQCILMIDSLTHYWNELLDSYMERKKRQRILLPDWQWLKGKKGARMFTDAFLNSQAHIFWCARAGFEFSHYEDESGSKQMEKTGVKPKAETESGYEPSILVLMERHMTYNSSDPTKTKVVHLANVVKDRGPLDGKVFTNPTFKDFKPHFDCLALGGHHTGIDTDRTSEAFIPPDSGEGRLNREQRDICLDEIKTILVKHHPGQSAASKKAKGELLEEAIGTFSWARAETMELGILQAGRNKLWQKLEGKPFELGNSELAEAPSVTEPGEIPF